MFEHLIVSGPRKRPLGRSIPSGFFSLLVHGFLITGGLVATGGAYVAIDPPADTIIWFLPDVKKPDEAPREEEPAAPTIQHLRIGRGHQTVAAPIEIPDGIPPIDLDFTIDPRDYTGRGITDGRHDGIRGVTATDGMVFLNAVVDEAPEVLSCPPLQYPQLLAQAGVTGGVVLQFVVSEAGSVEDESIVVINSDNRGFERSALETVGRCRFRPGRIRGTAVRVLVEQGFEFGVR